MKRTGYWVVAVAAVFVVLMLAACGTSDTTAPKPSSTTIAGPISPDKFTVSLVTDVGRLYDRSFNQMAWKGVKGAERRLGIRATVAQSHTVRDYVRLLVRSAREHATLTIAVGSSMAPALYQVAKHYPAERFAIVDARPVIRPGHEKNLPNVANILFEEQESGYVAGVLAGLMAKHRVARVQHNTIGYMGALPIPAVEHYLAGYVAGAKHVNPSIRILGDYSRSFSDAAAGKAIAQRQIRRGADILFQVAAASGVGYLSAARQQGRYGIGVDTNQKYLGPFILASAVKRVDVAVEKTIERTQAGDFLSGDNLFGAAQGAAGISPPSSTVPPTIAAQAQSYMRRIARGEIQPPLAVPAR